MDKGIIGKRVREQRDKLSLTREKFAEKVDISPRFLAEIEYGTKGMSAETLYKICERIEVSSDYILLGRQSTEGIHAPIAEIISAIPTRYYGMIEDILRSFSKAIRTAEEMEGH